MGHDFGSWLHNEHQGCWAVVSCVCYFINTYLCESEYVNLHIESVSTSGSIILWDQGFTDFPKILVKVKVKNRQRKPRGE
jgi:hypothetical protein